MSNKENEEQEILETLQEHMDNPRFVGLLETYDAKATCKHASGHGKVTLTLKIGTGSLIKDCGFTYEGCPTLLASASLFLDTVHGQTLSEAAQIAAQILMQIQHDDSKESRCNMMFLKTFGECVEDFFDMDEAKEERVTTLSF